MALSFLTSLRPWWIAVALAGTLVACGGDLSPKTPPATLPSAPRITPTPAWSLCDRRENTLMHETGHRTERSPWGMGEEITVYRPTAGRDSEYHLFFDDRGIIVGYIGVIYEGLDVASQQSYRAWMAKQIATEFILTPAVAARSPGARSGRLYADQGERISGRAIVIPRGERQLLHVDANMLTAYAPLLSPYKPEYLNLILLPAGAVPPMLYGPYDSESRDYIARQQFAKGEVAHFALCGDAQVDVAIEAYKRAIDIGLSETLYQAEAYHRLGLAYRDKGLLPEAKTAIETSLKIRPAIPEVVNHLGKIYGMAGDNAKAVELFHKAIGLKPNYALAYFNLAEAIEAVQPRRALTAYENYLAFVELTPGERERIAKAKDRVQALRKSEK